MSPIDLVFVISLTLLAITFMVFMVFFVPVLIQLSRTIETVQSILNIFKMNLKNLENSLHKTSDGFGKFFSYMNALGFAVLDGVAELLKPRNKS